jgi:hypothetical protein
MISSRLISISNHIIHDLKQKGISITRFELCEILSKIFIVYYNTHRRILYREKTFYTRYGYIIQDVLNYYDQDRTYVTAMSRDERKLPKKIVSTISIVLNIYAESSSRSRRRAKADKS